MKSFSLARRGAKLAPSISARKRKILMVEELEDRCLLSVYTPAQMRHAYGFDQIMFGNIKGDGTGQTIAIIDAYDAPNIDKDLQTFDKQFGISNNDGLGNYVLTKATPQGKPAYNAGWSQEITLDVEWAHAIAPGAHILLVEAASNSFADLMAAVDYARSQPGVSAVSMSFGSNEFVGESAYDFHFTTPTGHNGVTFVASSGDTGAVPEYPAVSPNVLAVGGTTLKLDSAGNYISESAWSGSGGGISAYESKPSYQSGVTASSTKRTSPDVSYDANPATGVYVYWTNASTGAGGWYSFGGTSAGAPQWAALIAIANQGRALNGLGSLDGRSQLLPAIYNLPGTDFHDVTTGTASSRGKSNKATLGYDLATGRGSPIAQLMVQQLLTVTSTGTFATASKGGTGGAAAPAAASNFFTIDEIDSTDGIVIGHDSGHPSKASASFFLSANDWNAGSSPAFVSFPIAPSGFTTIVEGANPSHNPVPSARPASGWMALDQARAEFVTATDSGHAARDLQSPEKPSLLGIHLPAMWMAPTPLAVAEYRISTPTDPFQPGATEDLLDLPGSSAPTEQIPAPAASTTAIDSSGRRSTILQKVVGSVTCVVGAFSLFADWSFRGRPRSTAANRPEARQESV